MNSNSSLTIGTSCDARAAQAQHSLSVSSPARINAIRSPGESRQNTSQRCCAVAGNANPGISVTLGVRIVSSFRMARI